MKKKTVAKKAPRVKKLKPIPVVCYLSQNFGEWYMPVTIGPGVKERAVAFLRDHPTRQQWPAKEPHKEESKDYHWYIRVTRKGYKPRFKIMMPT